MGKLNLRETRLKSPSPGVAESEPALIHTLSSLKLRAFHPDGPLLPQDPVDRVNVTSLSTSLKKAIYSLVLAFTEGH